MGPQTAGPKHTLAAYMLLPGESLWVHARWDIHYRQMDWHHTIALHFLIRTWLLTRLGQSSILYLEVHPLSLDGEQHLDDFADEWQRSFPLVDVMLKSLDEARSFHSQQLHLVVLQRLVDVFCLSATSVTQLSWDANAIRASATGETVLKPHKFDLV